LIETQAVSSLPRIYHHQIERRYKMTDKQKTTQEEPHAPFEDMPFAAMMKKMMGGQQGGGCNCAEMMAQMTAMCGGAQATGETEASAQEAAQKAKGAKNG
jgi:hypothetical protein